MQKASSLLETIDKNEHVLYFIIFPGSSAVYVGITCNLQERWSEHRRQARLGAGYPVYRAMRKYPDCFIVALEKGTREYVSRREVECISALPKEMRYNRALGGDGTGMLGLKHSDETRAKMSASGKAKKLSPEHIAKSAAARTGQKRTPEQRAKMSEGQKRRVRTEEEIQRMRVAAVGRVVTPEHRARLSASAKARWARELAGLKPDV